MQPILPDTDDPVLGDLGRGLDDSYGHVAEIIRARRTNLLVDPDRPVSDELIDSLCEMVTWAPCHKRTWPWVFAVFTGQARARLGDVAADMLAQNGEPEARVTKTRGKYLRSPVTVVIGAEAGDSDHRTAENRDAVAAGVQNLLLGATAAGLASFWASCPFGAGPAVTEAAGFEPSVTVVAMVYLGWPNRTCPAPERPTPSIIRHT